MNTLFGLSMDTIMMVCLALFLAITAVIAVLALRNPLMFKLGLRNVPRRRAQTVLIVVGLMLSTVIITSAFGTGDTMTYSIRGAAVTQLGAIDEIVTGNAATEGATTAGYFPASTATRIGATLAADHNVDGVTGAIVQPVALQDLTSRQTKARVELLGVPARYPAAFGPLTTAQGAAVTLSSLGAGQVYLNQAAAQSLNAQTGDRLRLFVGGQPVSLTVHAVLASANLAAGGLISGGSSDNPALLLPLDRLQRTLAQPQQVNIVLISNKGDALSGAALSDKVTGALIAPLANTAQVAAAKAILSTPRGLSALQALQSDKTISTATKASLQHLRALVLAPGLGDDLKATIGDQNMVNALHTIKAPAVAAPLNNALASLSAYSVQPVKQDALNQADLDGNAFSSIFLVFGLFSITAGIMLIFLIFVMLAAERRAEMGMARAVGTKRRHLIEQFLFEGYAYDLGAALVGVGLGIGVGLGMTSIIAALAGTVGFALQPQIAAHSVVVAFCLGALVTFITVAFSSWRVSRLNVVAAIRDLPENLRADGSIAAAFGRPLDDLRRAGRRWRNGHYLGALRAAAVAPWHLLTAFRVFISRGPVLILAGLLLLNMGIGSKELFPFDLGISLLLIGAAMLLRWVMGALRTPDRVRNRVGYTLAGLSLVIFWLLPFDAIRSDLHSDVEMFFLSGVMLVLGGVWTVMFNSDLLLGGLLLTVGRIGSLAPALKTAVTYPLQNRLRTGLTLSMFSLVIFTLMVMSVLTSSFGGQGLNLNRDAGGYAIFGDVSPLNPIHDVNAAIAHTPNLRGRITAAGALGSAAVGVRQPGQKDQAWQPVNGNVADADYLNSTAYTLHSRARGYTSDAQVWQALRTHPGAVVVAGDLVASRSSSQGGFTIKGFYYQDKSFAPTRIEMRDARSGAIVPLTVIGVLDQQSFFVHGIYLGQATFNAAHLAPVTPTTYYFRVAPGQNVHQTALALGSAFLPNGLDVKETQVEYNQGLSLEVGLESLLEGFMALGLVVGIAALGVVATRSVVERRQHIGMLRAIGFKRRMVQASFLLESSIISILGTVLGVALGLMLARQLIAFFGKSNPSLHLVIPWAQIGGIVLLAYLASLLTTYLPAWRAARIYPAEALRYE